jgi:hypothetical protein
MQSAIEEGLGTIKLQIETQETITGEYEEEEHVEVTRVDPIDIETPRIIDVTDPEEPKKNKKDVLF